MNSLYYYYTVNSLAQRCPSNRRYIFLGPYLIPDDFCFVSFIDISESFLESVFESGYFQAIRGKFVNIRRWSSGDVERHKSFEPLLVLSPKNNVHSRASIKDSSVCRRDWVIVNGLWTKR